MSSELKNKLLNMEATPPPQVWQAIAAELDDSALSFQFPARLKNLSATPPPDALANIFEALGQEANQPAYTAALYKMEVPAPVAIWPAIKKNLDNPTQATIIEHRRFAPFIKYAAAAAIAGLLFWGGLQFFSGKNDNGTIAETITPAKKDSNTTGVATAKTITAPTENVTNNSSSAQADDEALEQSKKVYASVDVPAIQKKIRNNTSRYSNADPVNTVNTRGLPEEEVYETADEQLARQDKYIMLMTPDGNLIRMSKKMGDMVCCVSGEEQDKECVDQMTKWRKQIADHPKAVSPGNFLDIVSLVNSLDEE